ncbi:MAG: dimethylargininase [Deltaproteobacteria bacterium]|nr:dimethylargininase [Kofleriaceae bacterium]
MLALVRSIPDSYAQALTAVPADPPIDVIEARAQHAAYAVALAGLGVEVITLAADEAHPDCVFVEDAAVVAGEVAVITRPGAPSRQGEVDAVAAALAGRIELHRMPAPATLDGGDCLRLGHTIYVGRSARTNDVGVSFLRQILASRGITVVSVPLPPEVLHLKCVCARLDDERVLVADGSLPDDTFGEATVVRIPADESYAANVLTIGATALCADGFPQTRATLEAAGFRTIPLVTTEARKADGALTCMSILI